MSATHLRSFRDIDGREVDFVLLESGKPIGFVAGKGHDAPATGSLAYLRSRFSDVPAWQVSAVGTKDYVTPDGIRVAPAEKSLTFQATGGGASPAASTPSSILSGA